MFAEVKKEDASVNELMSGLAEKYGQDNVKNKPFIRAEAVFARINNINMEDAIAVMDPRYPQEVIRELLLSILEGVPREALKEVESLDVPETIDISRMRKQYYAERISSLQERFDRQQKQQEEATGLQPASPAQDALYAETLQLFVTEIRRLVSDQQDANRSVMEMMTQRENAEKDRLLSVSRMQEAQIRDLRETVDEKDDRIFRLQEALQSAISEQEEQAARRMEQVAVQVKQEKKEETRAAHPEDPDGGFFRSRKKDGKGQDRKREREELFSILCNPEIDEEQLAILTKAFDDKVPMDKIRTIATKKLPASRMKKALMVYGLKEEECSNGQERTNS